MIVTFLKKLVERKTDEIKTDIITRTNEKYSSVTYGCSRFIDSYRFSSVGADKLVETLDNDAFEILKTDKRNLKV